MACRWRSSQCGEKRRNMSNAERKAFTVARREVLDSGVVVDVMDGDKSPNVAKVMRDIRTNMLQGHAGDHTGYGVVFHTRGASACVRPAPRAGCGTDKHGVGDYVRGQARTIGVGYLWCMLERSNVAAHHKIGSHRLNSSGQEFVRWRNVRAKQHLPAAYGERQNGGPPSHASGHDRRDWRKGQSRS